MELARSKVHDGKKEQERNDITKEPTEGGYLISFPFVQESHSPSQMSVVSRSAPAMVSLKSPASWVQLGEQVCPCGSMVLLLVWSPGRGL